MTLLTVFLSSSLLAKYFCHAINILSIVEMAELLFVPLKKSSDVDVVKPLKNLIQSTYNTGENQEDYSEALNELSRLRTNAIWKVFEKSSLEILYSYYDQLASLESKLPPQEVQVPFKWKDAFDKGSIFGGRMSLTVSSLAFERMCVLFNMAAQQSALAAQQPLDTEDSLKLAAKLLQQSAGIFGYLKANVLLAVHQETTPDLAPDTLAALAALMLAQAQEVIVYKCIRDEMKDSMVAKVCAQAEELYTEASRAMQRDQVRQLWERSWPPAVGAKQALMRGLAQYYQAQVCRQNKAVGEEIARLQLATEQLRAAAGGGAGVAGPAADVAPRAARQLASAIKDNDFIYHERVPEPRLLEPVPRAGVARPLEPPPRWGAGKDLFAALVPAAVHQALQTSAARRSELINAEIGKLRDATALLNSILASLSLPACIEGSAGLPASIRDKAAAVRAAGGVSELHRLMQELPELLQRNKDMLDEAERQLREEAEADAALREQFGARWSRTASPQLTAAFRANADKYRQIIDNAIRADNIVQQKFQQHKENIELLSGSEGDISAGVPAGEVEDAEDAGALAELRALLGRVTQLKAERDELERALQDVTLDLKDKFLSALAADGALDEPALSAAALGAALQPPPLPPPCPTRNNPKACPCRTAQPRSRTTRRRRCPRSTTRTPRCPTPTTPACRLRSPTSPTSTRRLRRPTSSRRRRPPATTPTRTSKLPYVSVHTHRNANTLITTVL
ncbi:apoptosis-linked gene 2-interacting protein X 1 isoform X2 [Plodia interpunctella]|uniref:apoptosis-linked gene 2-interacting protein X 1 isoform X2 n=1 Tax=Plodia interpunctella TaxID=58824 RepID=UPI002368D1EB|nr:apoptosis-linked gene 2-interacting protein X 1 isoform X2 [Plodia interpunctella]